MGALQVVAILLRLLLQSRAELALGNLALRQQGAVLQRSRKRPRLHRRDRIDPIQMTVLLWLHEDAWMKRWSLQNVSNHIGSLQRK